MRLLNIASDETETRLDLKNIETETETIDYIPKKKRPRLRPTMVQNFK